MPVPAARPGLKHLRPITLEPWQQELVDQATEDFVRGLIHSDGCRVIANDRGVKSIRYHFSNHSEDILGLFTGALDRLGIPWTRSTNTSSRSTAKPPPLVSTSSSARSAERHSPVNP